MTGRASQSGLFRLDTLVCACWLVGMTAAVFAASRWVVPFTGWAEFNNIYFQADIALVYSNMTEFNSNHYRTGMHPLFSIVMWPLVALIGTLTDAPAASIVRLLLALNSGAAAALAYVILRRVTATRIDASLFTLLLCVSASTVFWSTVPETFSFGATTILLMLAFVATSPRPSTKALVLANLATMSMTLTNWMVGIYATLRHQWPRWRGALRVLAMAGCVMIALGIAAKLVMPSSGYVGDFRRYVAWVRAPHASDVRSFLAHSVVAPAPVFRTRGDGALEVVNEVSSAGSGSTTGPIAVGLWLTLLVTGLFAALRSDDRARAFRDILLLSVGSQFLLHVLFADGPFLFAAHFTPLLVILAAYASRFRWSRLVVIGTIATACVNNLVVFNEVTDRLEQDLLPWLEAHGTPMTKPLAPSTTKPAVSGS